MALFRSLEQFADGQYFSIEVQATHGLVHSVVVTRCNQRLHAGRDDVLPLLDIMRSSLSPCVVPPCKRLTIMLRTPHTVDKEVWSRNELQTVMVIIQCQDMVVGVGGHLHIGSPNDPTAVCHPNFTSEPHAFPGLPGCHPACLTDCVTWSRACLPAPSHEAME